MKQDTENLIRWWIYKTIVSISFVRRIEWRSILKWLDPKEDEKILDIACGTGELSLKIAERGCRVYGIDISEKGITSAKYLAERRRIRCEFRVESVEDLPWPEEYFDKVVCSSSLEHFKDDIKALREIHRILKPNGRVVLTSDSFTYPISDELKEIHRKTSHVVNYYTPEKLKEQFRKSGLKMIRSKYLLNSWLASFFFKIRLGMKRLRIWWIGISFIAYPLCLVSDRLFGVKDRGYTLIAEGVKINL